MSHPHQDPEKYVQAAEKMSNLVQLLGMKPGFFLETFNLHRMSIQLQAFRNNLETRDHWANI